MEKSMNEIIKVAQDFAALYESYKVLADSYNQADSIIPPECGEALNDDFANVFYNLAKRIVDIKEN